MGFRNGFPLEKINAVVIQLMVVMGHSVVPSKLKTELGSRVAFPVQFLSKLTFVEKLLWLSRKHLLEKNHRHLWNFLFYFYPAGRKKLVNHNQENSPCKLFQPGTTRTYFVHLLQRQIMNKMQRKSRLFFVQNSIWSKWSVLKGLRWQFTMESLSVWNIWTLCVCVCVCVWCVFFSGLM